MGDLVAVAFILVLITGITLALVGYHNKQVAARRQHRASNKISVYCEHEGELKLFIGSVSTDDPKFTWKIEEIRSCARDQAVALGKGWKVAEHTSAPELLR